ncbi:MAG: hypothetical protein H7A23_07195 [Leptospiraceae bacterium]|nr:hypothetical protein [Leptospiraceae bacterium]
MIVKEQEVSLIIMVQFNCSIVTRITLVMAMRTTTLKTERNLDGNGNSEAYKSCYTDTTLGRDWKVPNLL